MGIIFLLRSWFRSMKTNYSLITDCWVNKWSRSVIKPRIVFLLLDFFQHILNLQLKNSPSQILSIAVIWREASKCVLFSNYVCVYML